MNQSIKALGSAVRKSRKDKHLSQEALAEKIGVCKRTIIEIENSSGNPKFEILCKLVRELDLPIYKVFYPEVFVNNMKGTEKNNIKKGVYFYSQAINKKEIDKEIDMILKSIEDYSLEYPIAISLKRYESSEETRVHALSNEKYIDLIKYFCIRIKQEGYTPMIMGEEEWFRQFKKGTFDGYLKLASNESGPPNDINNCIIWEYKENAKGVVKGIDTEVELSLSAYKNDAR